MFTPVSAFTTAEPPRSSMAVTMIFVKKQKARNTMCAAVPHLKKNIIIKPVRKKAYGQEFRERQNFSIIIMFWLRLSTLYDLPCFYNFTNSVSMRGFPFDLYGHYTKQKYLFITLSSYKPNCAFNFPVMRINT